jgi:hypothetical protein
MTSPKSPKLLIKKPENWDVEIQNNMLQQAAYLAEFNLQASGAIPEKDYNLMDCFLLGAFVYLGSKIDDMTRQINKITSLAVDIEVLNDNVEDSKDISDADESKTISKSPFIIGYQ